MGPQVTVLDASLPVARRVQSILQSERLLAEREGPGTEHFWTSGDPQRVAPVIAKLWGRDVEVEPLSPQYSVPADTAGD